MDLSMDTVYNLLTTIILALFVSFLVGRESYILPSKLCTMIHRILSFLRRVWNWMYDKITNDIMWSLSVKAIRLFVDVTHCGYHRYDIKWLLPLSYWNVSMVSWIRSRKSEIAEAFIDGTLMFNVFWSAVCACAFLVFIYFDSKFKNIYIQRVSICNENEFEFNSFDNLDPMNQSRGGIYYWKDSIVSMNRLPADQAPFDWIDDNIDGLKIIYSTLMKWTKFRRTFSNICQYSSDDDTEFESWSCSMGKEDFDDFRQRMEATEKDLDDLDSERIRKRLEWDQYSSLNDPYWVQWFWDYTQSINGEMTFFVNYIPDRDWRESHSLHVNPQYEQYCDHWLKANVVFDYTLIYSHLAMMYGFAINLMVLGFIWSHWSTLAVINAMMNRQNLLHILQAWNAQTHCGIQRTMILLTEEWVDQVTAWNMYTVRRRLEERTNALSASAVELAEMDRFQIRIPPGIGEMIHDAAFHPLIQEICAEKVAVTVLREQWNMGPKLDRIIRGYAFSDEMHTIQMHYPLMGDRCMRLERFMLLRTTMRSIRVMVIFCNPDIIAKKRFKKYRYRREYGMAVEFDHESNGYVDCAHVIQ